MNTQFNIADAQSDIKELNDYLLEVGNAISDGSVHFRELETLMNDPEFSRLMKNVIFFAEEGHKHLAKVYNSLAKFHEGLAAV